MNKITLKGFVEGWNDSIKNNPLQTEKLSRSNLEWLEQTMIVLMIESLGQTYDLTLDDLGYIINNEEELNSLTNNKEML